MPLIWHMIRRNVASVFDTQYVNYVSVTVDLTSILFIIIILLHRMKRAGKHLYFRISVCWLHIYATVKWFPSFSPLFITVWCMDACRLGKTPIKFSVADLITVMPTWRKAWFIQMIEIDGNWTISVIRTDSLVFYVVEYTDFDLGPFISVTLDTIFVLFRIED